MSDVYGSQPLSRIGSTQYRSVPSIFVVDAIYHVSRRIIYHAVGVIQENRTQIMIRSNRCIYIDTAVYGWKFCYLE